MSNMKFDYRDGLRRIDTTVGHWLWWFLPSRAEGKAILHNPKKIAVIKLFGMGEAILVLPALAALKKQQPLVSITVVTTSYLAPVFARQPAVKHIHIISLYSWLTYLVRQWRQFDLAIDAEPYLFFSALAARCLGKHSSGFATCQRERAFTIAVAYNDQQHVVQTYLDLVRPLGIASSSPALIAPQYQPSDTVAINRFFKTHNLAGKRRIVIAPTSGPSVLARRWPLARFIEAAQALAEDDAYKIILLGSPADKKLLALMQEHVPTVVAVTSFTLPQVFALLARCHLLIANDTGIMHIGAAIGVPTLGLFGPNLPLRFRPFNSYSQYLFYPCPHGPHINVHRGSIENTTCRNIQHITTAEVIRAAQGMLTIPPLTT